MKTVTKDFVTEALLKQYFSLLRSERIGETPETTQRVDKLESEIKTRLEAERAATA